MLQPVPLLLARHPLVLLLARCLCRWLRAHDQHLAAHGCGSKGAHAYEACAGCRSGTAPVLLALLLLVAVLLVLLALLALLLLALLLPALLLPVPALLLPALLLQPAQEEPSGLPLSLPLTAALSWLPSQSRRAPACCHQ